MEASGSGIEYREIKRGDLASFDQLIVQGMGKLERSTGLDELALALFQSLHNPGVWTFLKILEGLGRAPIKVFVGVDNGRVLGTASVIMLERSGYVAGVATDSQARRRGIASHLLERIHLEVQQERKEWAVLDVETENETAISLYRKLGYVQTAVFGWYVGPTPETVAPGNGVSPVSGSQMAEVADWVRRNLPVSIADPLPPTKKRLSYVETVIRGPRTPIKTWRLTHSGETRAVVRACYFDRIRTGFMLPLAFDSVPTVEPLTSLFAPAVQWVRSSGGTRLVATFPVPSRGLEQSMEALKMPLTVSTALMVRPAREGPALDGASAA